MADITVRSPFLIVPFCDRALFWQLVLEHMAKECGGPEIKLSRMQQIDVDVLKCCGATIKWAQRRMCRPTNIHPIELADGFMLAMPKTDDIGEIIQVVYTAHACGYTSKVYGAPNRADVEEAISRRFDLFARTNTLGLSIVTNRRDTDEIAGVCIAGIYPDSPNNFSTIHQISVRPEYRGKGLAKAMMLHSINVAHVVSPVIGLQVLIGNPAENLYRNLGFVAGPSFTEMVYHMVS